jgi:hypothetical protein
MLRNISAAFSPPAACQPPSVTATTGRQPRDLVWPGRYCPNSDRTVTATHTRGREKNLRRCTARSRCREVCRQCRTMRDHAARALASARAVRSTAIRFQIDARRSASNGPASPDGRPPVFMDCGSPVRGRSVRRVEGQQLGGLEAGRTAGTFLCLVVASLPIRLGPLPLTGGLGPAPAGLLFRSAFCWASVECGPGY